MMITFDQPDSWDGSRKTTISVERIEAIRDFPDREDTAVITMVSGSEFWVTGSRQDVLDKIAKASGRGR